MIKWQFFVPVNPEPWAIGPVGFTNKGGKPRGFVGENKQLRAYQDAVRDYLKMQIGSITDGSGVHLPINGPCEVKFWFWRRLDKYELQSGKKHSRHWADATNMQKALEDAIQGILTGNDKNNLRVSSEIVHQGEDVHPGIIIQIMQARPFNPVEMGPDSYTEALRIFEAADKFDFNNEV